jgi:hypothetical protein
MYETSDVAFSAVLVYCGHELVKVVVSGKDSKGRSDAILSFDCDPEVAEDLRESFQSAEGLPVTDAKALLNGHSVVTGKLRVAVREGGVWASVSWLEGRVGIK